MITRCMVLLLAAAVLTEAGVINTLEGVEAQSEGLPESAHRVKRQTSGMFCFYHTIINNGQRQMTCRKKICSISKKLRMMLIMIMIIITVYW